MQSVLKWLGARLSEKSTYAGIAVLLGAFGIQIRPDLWDSILTLAGAVGGLILVFTKEPS